jgi:hypothetical protein
MKFFILMMLGAASLMADPIVSVGKMPTMSFANMGFAMFEPFRSNDACVISITDQDASVVAYRVTVEYTHAGKAGVSTQLIAAAVSTDGLIHLSALLSIPSVSAFITKVRIESLRAQGVVEVHPDN